MEHSLLCWISSISFCHGVDLLNEMAIYFFIDYGFHHGQMLQIVVCLEKGVSREEFDKYTSNTPDIAWERPTQTKNNLRSSVVSCGYDR